MFRIALVACLVLAVTAAAPPPDTPVAPTLDVMTLKQTAPIMILQDVQDVVIQPEQLAFGSMRQTFLYDRSNGGLVELRKPDTIAVSETTVAMTDAMQAFIRGTPERGRLLTTAAMRDADVLTRQRLHDFGTHLLEHSR